MDKRLLMLDPQMIDVVVETSNICNFSFRRPFVFERFIVFYFACHIISPWGEGTGE